MNKQLPESHRNEVDGFLLEIAEKGVSVTNLGDLRERLHEVSAWRFAFGTMARNGSRIAITISGGSREEVGEVLARRGFGASSQDLAALIAG